MIRTLLFCVGVIVALHGLFYAIELSKTASTILATAGGCALYVVVELRQSRRGAALTTTPR